MIKTIIRCDHCNTLIKGGEYRIARLDIDAGKNFFDKELELCENCAEELRKYIMDWIQPKHYKYWGPNNE